MMTMEIRDTVTGERWTLSICPEERRYTKVAVEMKIFGENEHGEKKEGLIRASRSHSRISFTSIRVIDFEEERFFTRNRDTVFPFVADVLHKTIWAS